MTGTLAGALTAGLLSFDTAGLDYSLTALFIVLALEQFKQLKKVFPFVLGIIVSVFALLLLPGDKMLIGAILLSLGGLFLGRPLLVDQRTEES